MPKLCPIEDNGTITGYAYECPGCKGNHFLTVAPYKADNGASWQFNGDLENPTFSPSVLQKVTNPYSGKVMICHSFVRSGVIEYLSDCTHSMAGQKVEIPEWED